MRAIKECGRWCGRKWEWEIKCRRNLFVWEKDLEEELQQIVLSVKLQEDKKDDWN